MISIITPSFNSGRFIEETIQSILSQEGVDVEYHIIDGGSTDNTLAILKKYSEKVRWTSEPDKGQADAINKGFTRTGGEILAWINADDYYLPNILRDVVSLFETRPNLMMLYSEGELVDECGRFLERYPSEKFHYQNLAYRCFICQPTVFFRRALFEKAEGLDATYHVAFDLDFWIRIGKIKEKNPEWEIDFLRKPLACSRMHASAKTLAQRAEGYNEIIDIVRKHFGFVPFNWIYGLEETASGRYDAYFTRSPININLLLRSMGKWIIVNRYHPSHVIFFLMQCLMMPRRSFKQLSLRAGNKL